MMQKPLTTISILIVSRRSIFPMIALLVLPCRRRAVVLMQSKKKIIINNRTNFLDR